MIGAIKRFMNLYFPCIFLIHYDNNCTGIDIYWISASIPVGGDGLGAGPGVQGPGSRSQLPLARSWSDTASSLIRLSSRWTVVRRTRPRSTPPSMTVGRAPEQCGLVGLVTSLQQPRPTAPPAPAPHSPRPSRASSSSSRLKCASAMACVTGLARRAGGVGVIAAAAGHRPGFPGLRHTANTWRRQLSQNYQNQQTRGLVTNSQLVLY